MNHPQPVLSIGIPVHNGGETIVQALNSLLTQTMTDFEIIISDNASTDETSKICELYVSQDPRVRYFRQQFDIGPVENFQFVLDKATSEFFMWAAADDYWEPNWIAELLQMSRKHTCLAIGLSSHMYRDGTPSPHIADNRRIVISSKSFRRRVLFYLIPSYQGTTNAIYGICKRELMLKSRCNEFAYPSWDEFFIYNIMKYTELRTSTITTKYVRLHHNFSSVASNTGWPSIRRALTFYPNIIVSVIRGISFKKYWRHSSILERFWLVLLFPVAFLRSFHAICMQHSSG